MGRSRGNKGQRLVDEDEGTSRKVWILVGLVALVLIVGFGVIVWLDTGYQPGAPPDGVETFALGKAGEHTQDPVTYDQDPPAGGAHNPIWQNSGFYEAPVRNENAVHTMEHGAVWITYQPDLPQDQQDALRQMVEGQDCLVASPYPGLDSPIVASAWVRGDSPDETQGDQIRVDSADDPNLENFIRVYRKGPRTLEPGAACTGGTGEPSS